MTCPFLQEARVKYCDKSAYRKMIRIAGEVAEETCSTPRYKQCTSYQPFAEEWQQPQCPYLRASVAQYCAASATPRFVPYSEPLLSRCGNDSHHYCDAFLETSAAPAARRDYTVGGLRLPGWLYYSANHLWLDNTRGGSCHIGLDAFLARVLGAVERITFLKQSGVQRPSVVLTVRGVDLEVVFPNPILLTSSNLYLRANPARLTADPYGAGWLFQGVQLPGQPPVTSGLIRGKAAVSWMERETGLMSAFLSKCGNSGQEAQCARDGGVFSPDMLHDLNREEILRLFHEFFWSLRV